MGFCTDKRVSGVHAELPGVRAHAAAIGDHSDQILVQRERRGAGAAVSGPDGQADEAMEAEPDGSESRKHWADYSRAKDEMFAVTDTKQVPWFVVNAENKKSARLNVIGICCR
jgi:hypothetical protein